MSGGVEAVSRQCRLTPVSVCRAVSGCSVLPPFVRVITPRFAFHTGHITVGGSICAEFLTTTGWKPSEMNMNYILRSICGLLYAGQAKLEPSFKQSEYSLSEAKEAFQRVASQHGWKF